MHFWKVSLICYLMLTIEFLQVKKFIWFRIFACNGMLLCYEFFSNCIHKNTFLAYSLLFLNQRHSSKNEFNLIFIMIKILQSHRMYSRSKKEKKKETPLFILKQIIAQKWNWYQSSWIIVYFSLMLWKFFWGASTWEVST